MQQLLAGTATRALHIQAHGHAQSVNVQAQTAVTLPIRHLLVHQSAMFASPAVPQLARQALRLDRAPPERVVIEYDPEDIELYIKSCASNGAQGTFLTKSLIAMTLEREPEVSSCLQKGRPQLIVEVRNRCQCTQGSTKKCELARSMCK
eukprot:1148516-Pelagomonas_calceolata.AAC.1